MTNLQVDFGNGNGFVTASFNTTLSGVYTSIGNKQLIYKITFSDASIVQCYNNVYVPYIPSSGSARYANAGIDPVTGADIPDVILESPTDAHSGVDLFIRRSVGNTAGSNANPQLLKPLIIVEGLDLSSATSLLGNGYNYNSFRDEIIRPQIIGNIAIGALPFDQYLDDVAGYDLIFVNWHNGVDDILRNVLALRDVINFVNNHKQAGAQQNVVLGISMGGLVSRYCLAQMVKAGGTGINETQTRLLITHDSPHRGANIPLALQHLLQGLRKQKVKAFLGIYNKRLDEIVPQFLDVNTAINSPAATQQLLARVVDDNGTISYNTFLDGAYRTMVNFAGTGLTQPYRFVATSNGSQCGIPVAVPYSQLASLDADGSANIFGLTLWTKGRAYLDMRRLPDLGQTPRILDFNLKLKVKILVFNLLKISMQIQKNAPGNLLPLDGLAGGTRDLGGAVLSSNLSTIPPASGAANWLIFGYSYNYSTPYIAPTFSFVPTTSSLDVANFNAVNIPYTVPVTGLNGSRAANYIAQERITLAAPIGVTNNVNHTDFYARTCNWLYNEMENITQAPTCNDLCTDNVSIVGSSTICAPSPYIVNGLPTGTTITWSITPATGVANLSCTTCASTTLSYAGTGTVTLTASFSNPCIPPVTKTIYVGATTTCSEIGNNSGSCIQFNYVCPSQLNYWQYAYIPGSSGPSGTGYRLQVQGGGYFSNGLTTQDITSNYFSVYVPSGGASVLVSGMNSCGVSPYTPYVITYIPKSYGCAWRYSVSPNPATSSITVSLTESARAGNNKTSYEQYIDRLSIYNEQGTLVKDKGIGKMQTASLNIAELRPGKYFIEVTSGAYKERQLIIVQ